MSANELARYMVTPDVGRLGIIRRARESTTSIRIRYQDLRSGIVSYLTGRYRDPAVLHDLRGSLERRRDDAALTEFVRQDASSSLAALDAFQLMANQLGGFRFLAAPALPHLALGGVSVSVNLDMICLRDRPAGQQIGGVLIRMSKPDEETERANARRKDMGAYAATLAMMQSRSLDMSDASVHHELCMSIDIQCKEVHAASRNYATRSNQLEAACRFIAALWTTA